MAKYSIYDIEWNWWLRSCEITTLDTSDRINEARKRPFDFSYRMLVMDSGDYLDIYLN